MDRKVPINDATISRNCTRHLAGTGLRSPCHIEVQSRNGEVTLSGIVQYDHQRGTAVQAVRNVEGVKRIVEKLRVMPAPKRPYLPPPPDRQPVVEESSAVSPDTTAEHELPAASVSGQEAIPDATAESTTEVLATGGAAAEFWFRIDIISQ